MVDGRSCAEGPDTSYPTMQPATPKTAAPLIGTVLFERFELVERLATEPRGETYRAVTRDGGVSAVARFLSHPAFSGAAGATWDAIEEPFARLCAVDHPHLERVLTGGVVRARAQELVCVVAEQVEGQSLTAHLREVGRVPTAEALTIATRVALGLDAAHQSGLVHGDLRAGNVVLARNPPGSPSMRWPIVCDVGVNNLLSVALGGAFSAHELAWSPESAAPEQIRGEPATVATDVYALGLLLYRLLTGTVPFPNDNPSEMLVAQLSKTPLPLSERSPEEFSPWLEALVARCLAKRADERYESMGALLDVIEAHDASTSSRAVPRRPSAPPSPSAPPPPPRVSDGDVSSTREVLRASSTRLVSHTGSLRSSRPPALPGERLPTMTGPWQQSAAADVAPIAPQVSASPQPGASEVLRALQPLALAVVGVTFVCGLLGGYVAATLRRPEGAALGTLTVARPLVRPIRVRVRSNAPGAQAVIRGHAHALPVQVELWPTSVPEMIEVSAPGYGTSRTWMPLHEHVDAQLDLAPVVAAVVAAPAVEPSPRRYESRRSRRRAQRTRR